MTGFKTMRIIGARYPASARKIIPATINVAINVRQLPGLENFIRYGYMFI
jgi:hypothetical protein